MEKDNKEDNGSIAVARSQVRTHVQRRVKLNNTSIKKLKPKEKLYSIGDSEMVGVRIYVQPSGSKKGYYTCSKFS